MDNATIASKLIALAKELTASSMTAMTLRDVRENVRFYDPSWSQGGRLVTRKYHQSIVWMMLYDDGTITELTNGDLRTIKKI